MGQATAPASKRRRRVSNREESPFQRARAGIRRFDGTTFADIPEGGFVRPVFPEPGLGRRLALEIPPRLYLIAFAISVGLAGSWLVAAELDTSRLQSIVLTRQASRLDYLVGDGPSPSIRFPTDGPYDRRLGYTAIPHLVDRLAGQGFDVAAQARLGEELVETIDRGLFAVYDEKTVAGLRLVDRDGTSFFEARYPEHTFASFEAIPPILVRTLLYIENRDLLEWSEPFQNPAVEWDRMARAVGQMALRPLGWEGSVAGGSTLATQIEKFRHSPSGVTTGPREKARQIASASLRAYRGGRVTGLARRGIVADYVNSVPLAAIPGYGEVNGLGAGLRLWYGIDPEGLAELWQDDGTPRPGREAEAGTVYAAALSLFVAHRRPTYYLARREGRDDLVRMTRSWLSLLEAEGVVPRTLAGAARSAQPPIRDLVAPRPVPTASKASSGVRAELLRLLGLSRLYDLDRYDLTVSTTLDATAQAAVEAELTRLRDPAYAREVGLTGFRLLEEADPSRVVYAIVLYESTPRGNAVRVRADSYAGPFDPNAAAKLELGSTAKLRTLVTYLEVVEELHARLSGLSDEDLQPWTAAEHDPVTRWVAGTLRRVPDMTVEALLAASLERRYSASPHERFFTGGGVHRFSNFDGTHDAMSLTVREGFRQSVNLVFIRLMRDIVAYHTHLLPGWAALTSSGPEADEARAAYLARFAEREGLTFLRRFFDRYRGRSESEILALLAESGRLVSVAGRVADIGDLRGVHPLELWVARYVAAHPDASWADVVSDGEEARGEAYAWLFRTSRREAQRTRIATVLEIDAFAEIHGRWRRLGYPFAYLVPSYATSIGSSADRPAALAELVGIVLNDGMRNPIVDVERMRFAEATPYETLFERRPGGAERVMSTEVAAATRSAMVDVVERGTARRLHEAFTAPDGSKPTVGGKTGTGDNRRTAVDRAGRVISTTSLNRTSTLAFFLGERHFGVITAYVEGADADAYRFTSSLASQVLRGLAPAIEPLLGPPTTTEEGGY